MSRSMRLAEGLRALAPFCTRLAGAGGWLSLGLLLGALTLIGSLGLLSLSGGFLTGAALAGLTSASAALFNFFMPGAGVRFFAVLRTVCRWGERVVTHEGTFRLLAGLRVWLYQRMARLSPRQLTRFHGGEMLNRLLRDIDALDNLYPRTILPVVTAVLVFALLVALFAWIAPVLLWLPLLLILLAVSVLPLAGWQLGNGLLPRLVRGRAVLRTHLLDCCEGLEDFSLHAAAWERQRQSSLAAATRWLDWQKLSARRASVLRAAISLLIGLAAWACLGLLASEPSATRLGGPWLAALTLLLLGCAEALLPLAGAAIELPGTAAAAERIDAVAGQTPSPQFPESGPAPAHDGIEIRDLHFAWDEFTPVFAGLDLDIAFGEHVLIEGASGCGKSTLIQLLTRFEEPQAGSIRLGGVALAALDEATLRRHIACASQFTWAKTGTLADNLRLADPSVSAAGMQDVLSLVGLDPARLGWHDGLETWIEEGGTSLSGGQRRRLSIARALLRAAPVTILDEPTEGLDQASENALIGRIAAHLRGKTLIWVSHRDALANPFGRVIRLGSPTPANELSREG